MRTMLWGSQPQGHCSQADSALAPARIRSRSAVDKGQIEKCGLAAVTGGWVTVPVWGTSREGGSSSLRLLIRHPIINRPASSTGQLLMLPRNEAINTSLYHEMASGWL